MLLPSICDLHACSYFAALEQYFNKYFNSAVFDRTSTNEEFVCDLLEALVFPPLNICVAL